MTVRMKSWAEKTYQDEMPEGYTVRVNKGTIDGRLRKCGHLLKRGGGIFHEPGGMVISVESVPLIEEMIEDGRLRDDGPVGDPKDARIFTYTVRE